MTGGDPRAAVEAVWRIESARLIAGLARMAGDLGLAEDAAQDALVAALEHWPATGVPDSPGAWLMTVGKRRLIDQLRRRERLALKQRELARQQSATLAAGEDPALAAADEDVRDDLLRLIFTTCHPVLSTPARVALTLKLLGGLSTGEIARAFLVPEPTLAQRIVRAKRTLASHRVPVALPAGADLPDRLPSVLEVIYLIFNEGYAATAGDEWVRPALCEDAQRLARVLAGLMPAEPEVWGLVALLELQASRLRARTGPDGQLIRLAEQDRSRWDRLLIRRGMEALARAEQAARAREAAPGPYHLQAAIAACHARAGTVAGTDWPRIAAYYAALAQRAPSPVVELNRAVALGMAFGPQVGLALLDELRDEPALATYHLFPAVRGDMLVRLGRATEAADEFLRAASLTGNARERELLRSRAVACAGS